jgi:Family of unknown function (DUF6188)
MYGLPHDIDLAFFIQQTLLQVCIGACDLILNFEGVSVTVTSSVGFADSTGAFRRYDDFPRAASDLVTLLNQSVTSAEGDNAGTLTLRFDGAATLSIYDDSKQYESYTVKNGAQIIVV